MATAEVILALLRRRPAHGYTIKREHDAWLPDARPLAYGQVYATLGRLERDGLVESVGQDRAGGPDRTSFALTDLGRTALDEWLGQVEPPVPHVSSVLLAKVVVALLAADADRARGYLVAQRRAHTDRLRELTAIKTDPEAAVGDVVAADLAIAHLDADLRWLRTTVDRITDLHREVRT